mmetsp:Transcript_12121/g.10437  ORF Transcript_12121/g.10437 Transcript_12121/m.10437 type:complete len:237 (+) Transcript_12121:845-1555(+)
MPQTINFKSLQDSLQAPLDKKFPPLENPDMDKWGRAEQLHIGLNGLLEFVNKNKRLPTLHDDNDASEVTELAKAFNDASLDIEGRVTVEELNKEVVQNISKYSSCQLSPHSAFWGGIVAQEVVKFTGKFMPIRQWLHYETLELLPKGEVNRKVNGTRYDDQVSIFGQEFQEKIMNQKIFLVGAGALGCEFIKQFALTGLCCGPNGKFTCTDDDNIEISNLNRQFLFRKDDVGSSKS